jgi:cytochrome c oxidase subunit II
MRIVAIVSFAAAAAIATAAAPTTREATRVREVAVVASKFAFEPAEIQVVAGEPVRLVVRSADAVHGFAIRDLSIDLQIRKGGEPVVAEFTAPPPGRYEIACSEFCGRGHALMKAALVSVAPAKTSR